jgi:protoporphyrinogen oxidase
MSSTQDYAIVGGGLLGMTLAWELAKGGHRISLFEAGSSPGGLASAWQIGDIVWDRHYHVTLFSDAYLRSLLGELGLDREMQWRKVRTGFYCNGSLHPFSRPVDFLRFPLLGPIDKLRFALAITRASRIESPAEIEGLTVEEWLVKISGKTVYEAMWRPLLRCKLGDDYQTTSASFIWATIRRLYAARRTGTRQELFGYLPGGYSRMLQAFAAALERSGVRIYLDSPVHEVVRCPDHRIEVRSAAAAQCFDRVVITAPAAIAAQLCPQLTSAETELLLDVDYRGVICTSLLLSRPLSDYYITNIADGSISLTGVIEMSALVDREAFRGHALVYLPRYLHPQHSAFKQSDQQLESESIAELRRIHPSLRDNEILACRVSRARYVFPRPTPGSRKRQPPVDTSVPGIHILNSTHIGDGTLNVNETVQLARVQAWRLHELAA